MTTAIEPLDVVAASANAFLEKHAQGLKKNAQYLASVGELLIAAKARITSGELPGITFESWMASNIKQHRSTAYKCIALAQASDPQAIQDDENRKARDRMAKLRASRAKVDVANVRDTVEPVQPVQVEPMEKKGWRPNPEHLRGAMERSMANVAPAQAFQAEMPIPPALPAIKRQRFDRNELHDLLETVSAWYHSGARQFAAYSADGNRAGVWHQNERRERADQEVAVGKAVMAEKTRNPTTCSS